MYFQPKFLSHGIQSARLSIVEQWEQTDFCKIREFLTKVMITVLLPYNFTSKRCVSTSVSGLSLYTRNSQNKGSIVKKIHSFAPWMIIYHKTVVTGLSVRKTAGGELGRVSFETLNDLSGYAFGFLHFPSSLSLQHFRATSPPETFLWAPVGRACLSEPLFSRLLWMRWPLSKGLHFQVHANHDTVAVTYFH